MNSAPQTEREKALTDVLSTVPLYDSDDSPNVGVPAYAGPVAKELAKLGERIDVLQERNRQLESENELLKGAINEFDQRLGKIEATPAPTLETVHKVGALEATERIDVGGRLTVDEVIKLREALK